MIEKRVEFVEQVNLYLHDLFMELSGRSENLILIYEPSLNSKCFDENVIWVKGMSGGERRLAFKRGELNGTRENPAAYKKHVAPNEKAELWFHHGILQSDGTHNDDPNYPEYQFENLFEKKWGTKPQGKMYNAYKLVKSFRD